VFSDDEDLIDYVWRGLGYTVRHQRSGTGRADATVRARRDGSLPAIP
jgi:hypothetical protein